MWNRWLAVCLCTESHSINELSHGKQHTLLNPVHPCEWCWRDPNANVTHMSWAHCNVYFMHCQQSTVNILHRESEMEIGDSNMELEIVEWMQTNLCYKQNSIWQNNKHECIWLHSLLTIQHKKGSRQEILEIFSAAAVVVAFYVHVSCIMNAFSWSFVLNFRLKIFDGLTSTMKIELLSVYIAQKCYKVIYAISITFFPIKRV